MIIGVGIDNIEVERIKNQVDNSSNFKEKIFSPQEIEYCESKKNYAESFAARFTAKEAFLKAIGKGWRDGIKFSDIEVLNDKLGKPELFLHNKAKSSISNQDSIHVSLSHTKEMAFAFVIIERTKKNKSHEI